MQLDQIMNLVISMTNLRSRTNSNVVSEIKILINQFKNFNTSFNVKAQPKFLTQPRDTTRTIEIDQKFRSSIIELMKWLILKLAQIDVGHFEIEQGQSTIKTPPFICNKYRLP